MYKHVIGGTVQSTVRGNIVSQSPFLDHNASPFTVNVLKFRTLLSLLWMSSLGLR